MDLMQSIDDRTRLAGTNHLEVLLFSLGRDRQTGREEVFGVNVFKVREVLNIPDITAAPDMSAGIEGIINLRGQVVPVINLQKVCNIDTDDLPTILMVTEYNSHVQGFLVSQVETIQRLSWETVKEAPPLLASQSTGKVTAVAKMPDERLVMIMDVEQILSDVGGLYDDDIFSDIAELEPAQANVFNLFYVDDSSVARNQIQRTADKMGIKAIGEKNGAAAWVKLQEIANQCESAGTPVSQRLTVILTDVEMPEMDGYVLTKKIKADKRFNGIPVFMHSSLSADENHRMGIDSGADKYISKFKPVDLSQALVSVVKDDITTKISPLAA